MIGVYDGRQLLLFGCDQDHSRLQEVALGLGDAVLFCTPEYAGTLPGSFKNLLDWTVGGGDLYHKPVAWINVAAEGRGEGAQATLEAVLRYVEAVPIESACTRILIPRDTLGPDGAVTDASIRTRIGDVLATIADSLWQETAE